MEQTTICIIDDHAIVRQGLKGLLEKIGDYKVIKEFDDGDDFLAALPLSPAPDIYILDYSMPHKNGVEVL
ncbi:MAG TPA: response regulator, partial [Flavobacterium sp.]|nr:response regulator [Flavobacterium sp.]